MPEYRRATASVKFNLAWKLAMDEMEAWLNLPHMRNIVPDVAIVRTFVKVNLEEFLNVVAPGSAVSTGPFLDTPTSQADYCFN
ncbi:hypothetical protein QQ020_23205 [Fulvivirgaceae bacterium BMA12]|uniref:Uncharacterized protein n=1 Tax=Agaribacillus aureus TaxID=3051825 RepID=A0ABT8LB61_9BACT|nr:hypothetical protein [Fulvivirgaceae bacterium BMA12]